MNKEIKTGQETDRLELELKRRLRDIGNEEQPEKLLALARELQDLLRKKPLTED